MPTLFIAHDHVIVNLDHVIYARYEPRSSTREARVKIWVSLMDGETGEAKMLTVTEPDADVIWNELKLRCANRIDHMARSF